jgi:hypothetical protein
MGIAVIERLKAASNTIQVEDERSVGPGRADERRAAERREFAMLMRSIRLLAREDN